MTLVRLRNPWGYNRYSGAWKSDSSNWTKELKRQVNFDELKNDAGLFYASFEEYLSAFSFTTICIEPNHSEKYCHSAQTMIDFNEASERFACMKFNLTEDINCNKNVFAVNCYQQGPRLEGFKINQFKFSPFSILLVNLDKNEVVQAGITGHHTFAATLLLKESTLPAGEYMLVVCPFWNDGSTDHPDFKRVLVDTYGPAHIESM